MINNWLKNKTSNINNEYLSYLEEAEEEAFIEDVVLLYAPDEIEERYETHEMEEYLPNYLPIGNDSGDMEFLIKLDKSPKVYWCDPGSFSPDEKDVELVHASFSQWLKEGCPFED